jgi:hypothetical protein
MIETRPEVMAGYYFWAKPIVSLMKRSKMFSKAVWFVAKPWSTQMAYEMGAIDRGSLTGKILMETGIFFSGLIGNILFWRSSNKRKNSILF